METANAAQAVAANRKQAEKPVIVIENKSTGKRIRHVAACKDERKSADSPEKALTALMQALGRTGRSVKTEDYTIKKKGYFAT